MRSGRQRKANMSSYDGFARVYDTFMDNVPYSEWAGFLKTVLEEFGICGKENRQEKPLDLLEQERHEILDLGCGTGTLTEMLSEAGYDMIGVDSSEEMLEIAMEKREKSGRDILYLCQDMRNLELYGTVGAAVSVCDTLNYLLQEEEVVSVFSLVNNYLYPGGIFIFDFNTVYKYQKIIGDVTIAENREECSFIWENFYHREEEINEYDLTIFVKDKVSDTETPENLYDCYRKYQETHYQRGYTLKQMICFTEKAGLQFVKAMDADTHGEVTEQSERIYVIARECRKQKKG